MAIIVGEAIGEALAIDWRDRDGGWTEYIRVRVKLDVSKPFRRVVHLVGREETEIVCTIKYEQLPVFCYICCNKKEEYFGSESKPNQNIETNDTTERSGDENDPTRLKEKEKARIGEEDSESSSPIEKRPTKIIRDGGGRMRCKRKITKGGNRENIDE
ncbi:hypothetical protein Golob_026674, partial [Gossypium lobatum]|nr:hypothetical protein [Gossypium lobatum]